MTQEKYMEKDLKDLLLKDLCARIPYKVQASYYGSEEECETLDEIEGVESNGHVEIGQYILPIEEVKPYLFPLSSMTEEQKEFIKNQFCYDWDSDDPYSLWTYCIEIGAIDALIDLFNKYHIDYRGLIPRGLAIDATNLNIY